MGKQRKPDLAKNNYNELEQRVDNLMATERTLRDRREQVAAEEGDLVPRPNLPMDDKKLDIKVLREDDIKEPDDVALPVATDQGSSQQDPPIPLVDDSPTDNTPDELEDTSTDKAVKDIIAQEGDRSLSLVDEQAHPPEVKQSIMDKLKHGLGRWWRSPIKRNSTLFAIGLAILIVGIVPSSRYFVLNSLGVRSSMSVRIIDNSSLQPLRNVEVRIGEQTSSTDETGYATLDNLKLGNRDMQVLRRAFANRTISITIGWGSNPLGEYWLYPSGSQYLFIVEDFLSGNAITEAEVFNADVSALADLDGLARLTVDAEDDAPELEVNVQAEGYRTKSVTIDANTSDQQTIRLAPYLKHYFVSERDARQDIYAIDADGTNEELALEGTGFEKDDMTLLAHPEYNRLAVVSTREHVRNDDGFLLSNLTIIDTDDDYQETIATSERIQLIDWYGDYLVFLQITEGASGTNPERHRIVRYNYRTERIITLATSNYFNSVLPVGPYVYFAPSSIFQEIETGLERIHVVDDERETVLERESWSIFRTDISHLTLATSNRWYSYNLSDMSSQALEEDPVNPRNRFYRQNPWDDTMYLRAEIRDGQGRIVVERVDQTGEDVLQEAPGVGYPLRWLNKTTAVYRVNTLDETADYVVSSDNGNTQKITNVTPTSATERWYSY